ncbi:MAG: SMC-Scp complex subunit ScpB [Candidatus Pacearchaeota archaeon]|nr:SMC-Scp complex subunit ScpB [Candidatus Pacearchaeota archaeon]
MEETKEKELMKKIEAVLFLSAKFMSIGELTKITGINPITIRELLSKLEEKYKNIDSSICIVKQKFSEKDKEEEYYKMDVEPEFHYLMNKLATGKAEFSKAEQETLAIIAYKQPIKQSVVVKIRGNKAYEHIKHLMIAGLVRGKKLGRTLELSLTEKFYDYFNLPRNEFSKNENKQDETG